jgi:hypothetical protein
MEAGDHQRGGGYYNQTTPRFGGRKKPKAERDEAQRESEHNGYNSKFYGNGSSNNSEEYRGYRQ